MKGTISNLEGYVIKIADYKDNDAIVTFLSKEGETVFSAKGIKKPTSKNRASMSLLAKSKVSLLKNGESSILTESSLISFPNQSDDYLRAACLLFVSELNSKILSDDSACFYEWLDAYMTAFNKNDADSLTLSLIYFAQLLKKEGYGLDVDKCVICRKRTDIIGISLSDGGFLCRDDLEYESQKKDPYFLKMIRFCFKCRPHDIERVKFAHKDALAVINYLVSFYQDNTGDKIRGIDYLRRS